MKIKIQLASILLFAASNHLNGQFISSTNYNLGPLIAHGWSSGPALEKGFTEGTYYTKSNVFAFAFNFTKVSHKKGLSLGPVFSMALGGSSEKWMGKNLGGGNSNIDGVWGKDFGLFVDWKVGLGLNYCLPDKQTTISFRYFNWYNSNGFGGSYSNADDEATLGVAVNWQKLGLSYSYGSDKIPGVLVNGHAWNLGEVEAKYQLKYNEKTKGGTILGIRRLSQKLMETASNNSNTKGNLISVFVLFH